MSSVEEWVVALGASFQAGGGVALPDDEELAREVVRKAAIWVLGALLEGEIGQPDQVMRRVGQAIIATRMRPDEPNYVHA